MPPPPQPPPCISNPITTFSIRFIHCYYYYTIVIVDSRPRVRPGGVFSSTRYPSQQSNNFGLAKLLCIVKYSPNLSIRKFSKNTDYSLRHPLGKTFLKNLRFAELLCNKIFTKPFCKMIVRLLKD